MKKIAIIRGRFLNKYEMQFYKPLVKWFKLIAVGSLTSQHDEFNFPAIKLPSPVDLPSFPFKMQILNRMFIDANYLYGFERIIKDFDIVHPAETYYHFTIQSLNAKKKKLVKKVVVSVYENIPFAGEGIWGRKTFKQRVFKEADHLIAVSKLTKSALITEGADPRKITVINQHIDTNRFTPAKFNTSNKLTILFTGRLEEYKGVYDFVETAHLLLTSKELSNYTLSFVMVGEGSQKEKLKALVKHKGIDRNFTFTSYSYEDMPDVYKKADIYIAPSKTTKHWQEQFSTVLLEAKSSGLPIISTKTGGIPENVGKAGFLVSEGDYREISRIASSLIKNPKARDTMGKRARNDALKRFTIEKGAKKLKKVYDTLLQT